MRDAAALPNDTPAAGIQAQQVEDVADRRYDPMRYSRQAMFAEDPQSDR
jgi:hypothetical protein